MSGRSDAIRSTGLGESSRGELSSKPGLQQWWQNKHPVFRFVAMLALLLLAWELLFWIPWVQTYFFEPHLRVYALLTGKVLCLLGEDAIVQGEVVSTTRASVSIVEGCDAIQPVGLFIAAVLASPVPRRKKYPALFLGTLFLMATNLVRIVFLYYVLVYFPQYFERIHREWTQIFFIVLVVVTWVGWAMWAVGAFPRKKLAETVVGAAA